MELDVGQGTKRGRHPFLGECDRHATVGTSGSRGDPLRIYGKVAKQFALTILTLCETPGSAARSTGPALFAGGAYIAQLWLFWVAPILGAAIAGVVSRWQHELPDA
jgi:Major intrinsic protein